mmetsp:Transcript_48575/g.120432  ORF Transcript_48575/g.120432 Transcript_48575/m.120432 type:complete len:297 (-) Transcript_48575:940-1830(-)
MALVAFNVSRATSAACFAHSASRRACTASRRACSVACVAESYSAFASCARASAFSTAGFIAWFAASASACACSAAARARRVSSSSACAFVAHSSTRLLSSSALEYIFLRTSNSPSASSTLASFANSASYAATRASYSARASTKLLTSAFVALLTAPNAASGKPSRASPSSGAKYTALTCDASPPRPGAESDCTIETPRCGPAREYALASEYLAIDCVRMSEEPCVASPSAAWTETKSIRSLACGSLAHSARISWRTSTCSSGTSRCVTSVSLTCVCSSICCILTLVFSTACSDARR